MAKNNRSPEEKYRIIEEAKVQGIKSTLRKHGVSPSSYYDWIDRYKEGAIKGLASRKNTASLKPRKEMRPVQQVSVKEKDILELKVRFFEELTGFLKVDEYPLIERLNLIRYYYGQGLPLNFLRKVCKVSKKQYYPTRR